MIYLLMMICTEKGRKRLRVAPLRIDARPLRFLWENMDFHKNL